MSSSERTKVVIIGADSSAFHIFQRIYKTDDRYEVMGFVNITGDEQILDTVRERYPASLCGPLYHAGIPIIQNNPFQSYLIDNNIEKCIFSPRCVTSSMYLYLAAQCLAAECSVISHPLDTTLLPPPRALVSFFADTQFDVMILRRLLQFYKKDHKPLVVLPASLEMMKLNPEGNCKIDGLRNDNKEEFEAIISRCGLHAQSIYEMCNSEKVPWSIVYDLDAFCENSVTDTHYDMIIFVGLNSLPCYMESHVLIYACDDFTFGEDISQHPSSILCRQADVILMPYLASEKKCEMLREFTGKRTPVFSIPVEFSCPNKELYRGRPCLLVDDWYPVRKCNAVQSISKWLADQFRIVPVSLSDDAPLKSAEKAPIYGEPTEKNWPAIVCPNKPFDFEQCVAGITSKYDIIVSSSSTKFASKTPVLHFIFKLKMDKIPEDELNLPPAAFVKQKRRR